MAGKKGKNTQVQEEGNQAKESSTEQQIQPPQSTVPPEVADRLTRIEAVLEKLTALPQPPEQTSPQMVTRGRPRGRPSKASKNTRRSVSVDSVVNRDIPSTSHSDNGRSRINSEVRARQPARDAIPDVHPRDPAPRQDVNPVTQKLADPLLKVNTAPHSEQLIDVNTGSSWATWMQPSGSSLHASSQFKPQSVLAPPYARYDPDDVEQRVHDILTTTASSLSRGNIRQGPYAYPFKYVLRGTERQRVSIDSVSLSEHLWGIVRMIRDEKLDPQLRPYLNNHLVEVIEDSCDFQWENVRRWSEEVFGLIAEERLPGGWAATSRIQMLRMSISRLHSARYNLNKDQTHRDVNKKPNPTYTQNQELKGGPCQAYNSPSGCNFPSGHVVNGRKQQHVCTFCLFNNCAAYTHSEMQCRNKTKFPPHHF